MVEVGINTDTFRPHHVLFSKPPESEGHRTPVRQSQSLARAAFSPQLSKNISRSRTRWRAKRSEIGGVSKGNRG